MPTPLKIAVAQRAPQLNDLDASMAIAQSIIAESAENGAQLVVFGECWLSGYPAWIDHCVDYARWDDARTKKVYREMCESAIIITGPEIAKLCEASRQHGVVLCMGFNEIEVGRSTLYNSVLIIDCGILIFHHRKLMPTFTEKLFYGLGDGRGMEAVESSVGRIGALICWEHWMPLARQAMHDSGELIHIALWPNVTEMLRIASRHYAFEGRCYVVAAGQVMHRSQIPEGFTLADGSPEFILQGDSCLIDPTGEITAAAGREPNIFYCSVDDTGKANEEKMTLDVSGHYQRPDIFSFELKRPR